MLFRLGEHILPALILFVAVASGISNAQAMSFSFPKFGKPIKKGEVLIFEGPEAKRILCVSISGEKKWEREFDTPIHIFQSHNSDVYYQVGKDVYRLEPSDGKDEFVFALENENEVARYRGQGDIYYSDNGRLDEPFFRIIDRNTGRTIWKNDEIVSIVRITPALIIALATEGPRIEGSQSAFSIQAYHRETFEKKWAVSVKDTYFWLRYAWSEPYLFYVNGHIQIVALDTRSGEIVRTLGTPSKTYSFGPDSAIWDLEVHEGELVYLTSDYDWSIQADPDKRKHTLHFCTIPGLEAKRDLTLQLIEIADVHFYGDIIIAESVNRTACFRMNGEKVWVKEQMNRTDVLDGKIYFADYLHEGRVRLGIIEASTGEQTNLYMEDFEWKLDLDEIKKAYGY